MAAAGQAPASTRQIARTVTAGRVGVTIDLRRQENGHWYIHISRKQTPLPVPFAPELEEHFRPSPTKVIDAITAWMG